MKNTRYAILGIMLLSALFLAMPVSAVDVAIQGNTAPSFSMTITDSAITQTIPLNIGVNNLTANPIAVVSNTPFTIKAHDSGSDFNGWAKTTGLEGRMAYKAIITDGFTALTNPLTMGTNGVYYPLGAADVTIHTGVLGNWNSNLKYQQTVVPADPVLPGAGKYGMKIVVTGAAV